MFDKRLLIRFVIRFLLDVVTHPTSAAQFFKRVLRQVRRYPYRGRRRMVEMLGPDLASITVWPAVDPELHGDMAEIFVRTPRIQKFAHYLSIYESAIDRTKPTRMLQIGSFYEGSLQMWQEYLHPDSLIVGIDSDAKLIRIAESGDVRVRLVGEENTSLFEKVTAECGPFDVILDEGSHTSSHMVEAFRCLFASALHDSGVYIIEDVNCDYWKRYRDRRVSFIDFVRTLIDAMHGHYQVTSGETEFRVDHSDRIWEMPVPAITPMLGGIEIYDSIVIVRRAARELTRSLYRP